MSDELLRRNAGLDAINGRLADKRAAEVEGW
jgi:hypothetical protein